MGAIARIRPVAPFRLDLTAWALRRRPNNLVDRWNGKTYRRALAVRDDVFEVSVEQKEDRDRPTLVVMIEPECSNAISNEISKTISKMLGAAIDLSAFYRLAERDRNLKSLARRFAGLKPPRLPSLFEALLNGFACQQVSLAACITILNRLVSEYGRRLSVGSQTVHAFPDPEDLATLDISDFRKLGFSGAKGRSIIELSRSVVSGDVDLRNIELMDNESAIGKLQSLRGVGRWTAEFSLLRGLGRIDLFPGDDVGARNKLKDWLALDSNLDYGSTSQITSKWHPSEGLVYFHLLLNSLARSGIID